MNRLLYAIAFTSNIDEMKRFYRDQIGLGVSTDSPYWVSFESPGAGFALLAVRPEQKREIEMCFESSDVTRHRALLASRGVEFLDDVRDMEFGRVFHLRDPEGNLLSFLEPAPAFARSAQPSSAEQAGEAGGVAVATGAPPLTTIVIHGRDVQALKTYYRDQLGFALTLDTPGWITFDVGGLTLALHPTGVGDGRQPEPRVTPSYTVDRLMEWADEARERGVHFSTIPIDQEWGLYSAVTDPEGYEVCFCEYASTPAIEEELARNFEDDEVPQQLAIRRPVKKGVHAASRVALRPEYRREAGVEAGARTQSKAKPRRIKPKTKAKAKTRALAPKAAVARKKRGSGPGGTRVAGTRKLDPKRAGTPRPATGRLKKSERRTVVRKKTAIAGRSKAKPVKRAAASRGRSR